MSEEKTSIILGVTGGIAVYKAADLCSKLVSAGYDVTVVMTENAKKLISERIFFTLSQKPVITDLFDAPYWRPTHVDLAEKAQLLLVAPCTANFIGKLANGIADDALSTVAFTHTHKILLAPAMNTWMLQNPAYKENVEKLLKRGVNFIGPESGRLACGTSGEGRMSEVPVILDAVRNVLGK